jgi:cell division transport system permease protein
MRQIRIMRRVATETGLGLKRSGWSSWLVICILAIALTIFGGILQFTMTLKNIVNSWGSQLEISAYIKDGADPREVAKTISKMTEVKMVEIVPKQVAWEEMQTVFKVAALDNPLPNTLHIHVNDAENVEPTAKKLKKLNGVEHLRYPLKVARNINRFRTFLEAAGIVITAALSGATLMVIGSTIQLVIQARQKEIEILSLMGVSPWFIKGPLVLQGATYGAAAAALAIGVIFGVHLYLDKYVVGQLVTYMPFLSGFGYGMLPTFGVVLGLGVAVGAGGSYWTSGRFIKI